MRFCFVSVLIALCILGFYFPLKATQEKPRGTICLNMIIKNESHVIERCLSSLKHMIDYWVIVDTGSTDGTQAIVREFMKDVPGVLHERPWVNFAFNRNQALELAKGKADYIMFIDADEVLRFSPDFKRPDLTQDFYFITTEFGSTNYMRVGLVKDSLNWKWEGVVHEAISTPEAKTSGLLTGVANVPTPDGARSRDPEKYLKDAKLLEEDLQKNPNNTRNQFYLAQSYMDYGDLPKAIENYRKRVEMGGWDEEIYWSLLKIANLEDDLHYPEDVVLRSYFAAANYRPSRVEADYYLINHYRAKGDYKLAQFIAEKALEKPPSGDLLFIQQWMLDYGILFEYSICTYWTGQYEDSVKACDKLLTNPKLPENFRRQTAINRQYALDKMQQASYYKDLEKFILKCA